MLKMNKSSMEELNMYENINEYGGTPGSAAPADVPLDDLPPADNFSEMPADVPWRDDPPDGGYYSYSEYGESGIDECRQPDSVRAKNQKENSAEKQKNGGHSKKNLAVEYLANGTVSIKSAVRSKKTGEISVDVECARLLLPAETEELEKTYRRSFNIKRSNAALTIPRLLRGLSAETVNPNCCFWIFGVKLHRSLNRYCAVPASKGTEANMYSLFRNGTRAQCLRRRQVISAHLLRTVTVGIRRCALLPMQMRMTESILPNRS